MAFLSITLIGQSNKLLRAKYPKTLINRLYINACWNMQSYNKSQLFFNTTKKQVKTHSYCIQNQPLSNTCSKSNKFKLFVTATVTKPIKVCSFFFSAFVTLSLSHFFCRLHRWMFQSFWSRKRGRASSAILLRDLQLKLHFFQCQIRIIKKTICWI